MRRSIDRVQPALLTLAFLILARGSAAQLGKSFEIGFPVMAPDQARVDFLLLGFRVGSMKPLALGVDCSIATLPVLLTKGALTLGSGLDLAYPIPLGRGAILTPRVGGSTLVLAGVLADLGDRGVTAGYNAGVGLVGPPGLTGGVRLDFTHHWFAENRGISIMTIGFPMH